MINSVKLGLVVMGVVAAGCAAPHKSDSPAPVPVTPVSTTPVSVAPVSTTPDFAALQGTWKGRSVGADPERSVSLVLSGTNLVFHGADANDWCKGTFSLRPDTNPKQLIGVITDGPDPQYVGLTVKAIYRIEGGVLTIAGHAPGNPDPPAAFDEPNTSQIVLKAEIP